MLSSFLLVMWTQTDAFSSRATRGAYECSSTTTNCLHSICISASLHNATKHTENKRERRGGERRDRPNNKPNHKRRSLTRFVCVCAHRRGRQKARGGRGEMKTNAESERDRGRQRKERQREKSNLQEHNKKLYLWQKRKHKGICLAVCSSRILGKFIKLEPFKRRQSSKLYYRGGKERRGNGWEGVKGGEN